MFNPKKALENNQAPKDSGEKKYELLPEGRYTFTIEAASLTTASTGTDMLSTTLAISEGPFERRKVWRNFALTDKAFVFIAELLQATQSPLATSENVSAEDLVNDLPGRSFSALAYNKVQPNGNIKTDVKGFQTLTKAAENGNPSFGYAMQGEVSESPISSTANSSTGTSTGRPLFR